MSDRTVENVLAKYGYVTDSPAATVDTICEELEAAQARLVEVRRVMGELRAKLEQCGLVKVEEPT